MKIYADLNLDRSEAESNKLCTLPQCYHHSLIYFVPFDVGSVYFAQYRDAYAEQMLEYSIYVIVNIGKCGCES